MTWAELAHAYPEFVQWVAQKHGPLPDGPIDQGDYELLRAEHEEVTWCRPTGTT